MLNPIMVATLVRARARAEFVFGPGEWVRHLEYFIVEELAAVVRFCVEIGYADGAYVYSRILVRFVVSE